MREILFRGKRVDNGEWVYGSYLDSPTPHIKCFNFIPKPHTYEVDAQTVGKYIGVRDKNGIKIFEGDICCTKSTGYEHGYTEFIIEKWFIVKEVHSRNEIKLEKIKERRAHYAWGWEECHKTYLAFHEVRAGIVIVGNIYDNPEIIEDAKSFIRTDKYKE